MSALCYRHFTTHATHPFEHKYCHTINVINTMQYICSKTHTLQHLLWFLHCSLCALQYAQRPLRGSCPPGAVVYLGSCPTWAVVVPGQLSYLGSCRLDSCLPGQLSVHPLHNHVVIFLKCISLFSFHSPWLQSEFPLWCENKVFCPCLQTLSFHAEWPGDKLDNLHFHILIQFSIFQGGHQTSLKMMPCCQAQPQLQLQLSWAGFALLSAFTPHSLCNMPT